MDWTPARKRSFIISGLRKTASRWPPKYETLKDAFETRKVNKASGKLANHYKCANCKKLFTTTNVQEDHINPIVDPVVGFVSWDSFVERLFCPAENLQVLCKPCHEIKTQAERKIRNAHKKSNRD